MTRGRALVVGAGGIGTPCAWALADGGVERLTIVDSDVVEASNLPRQVLFAPSDVGRPKAEVAAERLARPGLRVDARVARFDATSAPELLGACDVVVDATDGAASKDLVNEAAVAARVPLVHAAAVGSEGRVLDGPPGGRPCIACLFGRLSGAEGDPVAAGTCADLGVWNGVTGAVGFLAAHAALERLRAPASPSRGLRVVDLATGRCVTLSAPADPTCPACGLSPRPPSRTRDAPDEGCAAPSSAVAARRLDLSRESCPTNLLLARRALDPLPSGADLEILLGEEGAATVPESLEAMGHRVLSREPVGAGLRLLVRKTGVETRRAAADEAWLRRYARQIVLPEVGEAGQRRIAAARVEVVGRGDALAAAAVYLAAAGAGRVVLDDPSPLSRAEAGRWPYARASEGERRDEALARALAATGSVVLVAGGGHASEGSVRVDVSRDESAGPSAIARAAACVTADRALRAIVGLPSTTRVPVVSAEGTVDSRPA